VNINRTPRTHLHQLTHLPQATRWQVLTALDITTELGLLLLPINLVWKLQMPRTKKAILLVAFYLRLPVIALSIGRNAYTLRLRQETSDARLHPISAETFHRIFQFRLWPGFHARQERERQLCAFFAHESFGRHWDGH
jgi:ABC-type uncharacterized transport system YnjBCD permease subunit